MESQNDKINRRGFVRFGTLATVMAGALATQIVQAEEKEEVITTEAIIAASQLNEKTIVLIQEFVTSLDESGVAKFREIFNVSFSRSNNIADAAIVTIASYDQLNKAYAFEIATSYPEYGESGLIKEALLYFIPWRKVWKAVVFAAKVIVAIDELIK